ncbi:MAG: hypothetical protein QXW00_02335 [Candidatus Woesearchaeota archaeon]
MKERRGVELSINVVIIAIIALVVLGVVILIFTNVMGENTERFQGDCTKKGGICRQGLCEMDETPFPSAKCSNNGEVCCLPGKNP